MVTTQQRGLDNTPTPEIEEKLRDLCVNLLEPVRALVGPLHVNSGYRSIDVNRAVGGQPTSQHCKGEAADVLPKATDLKQAAQAVLDSDLPYDPDDLRVRVLAAPLVRQGPRAPPASPHDREVGQVGTPGPGEGPVMDLLRASIVVQFILSRERRCRWRVDERAGDE